MKMPVWVFQIYRRLTCKHDDVGGPVEEYGDQRNGYYCPARRQRVRCRKCGRVRLVEVRRQS